MKKTQWLEPVHNPLGLERATMIARVNDLIGFVDISQSGKGVSEYYIDYYIHDTRLRLMSQLHTGPFWGKHMADLKENAEFALVDEMNKYP